jgi:hypothetical protein
MLTPEDQLRIEEEEAKRLEEERRRAEACAKLNPGQSQPVKKGWLGRIRDTGFVVMFYCIAFCAVAIGAGAWHVLYVFGGISSTGTLLVLVNREADVSLDGQIKGRVQAGVPLKVNAKTGKHILSATTTEGLVMVQSDADTAPQQQEIVRLDLDAESSRRLAEWDGQIWRDAETGLLWTLKDNGADMPGHRAWDYCHKLQVGGYSGWLLPNYDQLQTANSRRHFLPDVFNPEDHFGSADKARFWNVRVYCMHDSVHSILK